MVEKAPGFPGYTAVKQRAAAQWLHVPTTHSSFQVGLFSPDPVCHRGPILTPKIAAFGPLQALDECLEGAKMVLVHVLPCIGG